MSIRRAAVLLVAGLPLCACSEPPPVPLSLKIGVHEVELIAPPEWEHLDHGREQRFDQGMSQISLADMGPVTREGFEREIVHARELFRQRQLEDARTHLNELLLRPAFPNKGRWESFATPWNIVRRAGAGLNTADPEVIERTYAEVLAEIAALPTPDLPTITTAMLAKLGHDERYAIAEQQAMAISGRPALLVDTWDRLSHDQRRRYVFVLNEGNLLVARMELGRFSEMEPVFDALVASLRFAA